MPITICGVTVLTLRKHRDKGNVQPVEYGQRLFKIKLG